MKSTLVEKFKKAELEELVLVVETAENYTKECVKIVLSELLGRNVDNDILKQLARNLIREKIKDMFDGFSPINGKLTKPKSQILDEEEVMLILREEYEEFISRRDDLSHDVWAYAIGGIF